MIRQIVKKIPRPFNIAFNAVIFDEIDWFGESVKPMQRKEKGSLLGINTDIDSSHIAILKEFNYGSKENPVKIRIEVTDRAGFGILDDSMIVMKLNDTFGDIIMSDIEYKGLGFSYRINLCQYTPNDQDEVIKFIENVYAATRYLEQNYFPEIKKIYGKTPAWFQYLRREKRKAKRQNNTDL